MRMWSLPLLTLLPTFVGDVVIPGTVGGLVPFELLLPLPLFVVGALVVTGAVEYVTSFAVPTQGSVMLLEHSTMVVLPTEINSSPESSTCKYLLSCTVPEFRASNSDSWISTSSAGVRAAVKWIIVTVTTTNELAPGVGLPVMIDKISLRIPATNAFTISGSKISSTTSTTWSGLKVGAVVGL
jgi:hypothetical protein